MEIEKKDKILNMIEDLEKKNLEIKKFISSLNILSRDDLLKEISLDIIEKNEILKGMIDSKDKRFKIEESEETNLLQSTIESLLSKIENNPSKKVIYLKEYLENFKEISENDRKVILQSLKDENNKKKLEERMISLANIFK